MRLFWIALPALLAAVPAWGQELPAVGFDTTFETATWNVEWFGSRSQGPSDDTLQLQNVLRVLRAAQIDLWALQEVDDEDAFWTLVDSLGAGWRGELSTNSSNFRQGFIYRTDVVFVTQKRTLTKFSNFAGRPPLQIEADVMLPSGSRRIVLITLHMKAFDDATSYETRDDAADELKLHLDSDLLLGKEAVIVLGDFNDELSRSIYQGQPSPYDEFVSAAESYRFLTMSMDQEDVPTWCSDRYCTEGSTLDHILITSELFDAYEEGSVDRYADLVDALDRYTSTTSDHLPVYARFHFGVDTAEEPLPSEPGRFEAYPNPFREHATVKLTTTSAGPLTVDIFDALGRRVHHSVRAAAASGTHSFRVDGIGLAAGVYWIVLTHAGGVERHPLVRVR